MAAIGAAVGLGNLWRFPFQTGQHGGAAFVLLYLACVAFIGLPVLLGELAIGRQARGASAVRSILIATNDASRPKLWALAGWFGASASIFVLPIYCIIAGKILAFTALAFTGRLTSDAAYLSVESPVAASAWMTAFLVITVIIVARGLKDGIERSVSYLMPIFFLMLLILCAYALAAGDAQEALSYLFTPRFEDVRPSTVLAALGQALFSLAVGGAVMITYGALLSDAPLLGENAIVVASADTLVALTAGVMIFPFVFAFGLDPNAGMGLIFDALPKVFATLPGGNLIGGLFFSLAFVAALTSSISMLMISVTIGEDQFNLSRNRSIALFGGFALVVGVLSVASTHLAEWIDFFVGHVLLPLGALGSSLVAGWGTPQALMRRQLRELPDAIFRIWRMTVRYFAPIAISAILVSGILENL